MNWSSIRLSNVGPIEQGTIDNNRVCVFIGPNNAGKSIASRVIYGLRQLDEDALAAGDLTWPRRGSRDAKTADPLVASLLISRDAGIDIGDVTTRGKSGGQIDITDGDASVRFSFGETTELERRRLAMWAARMDAAAFRGAMYIPAGRAGTMQSLLHFMQIRNDLLSTVWETLDEVPAKARSQQLLPPPRTGGRKVVPAYLECFNNFVLEAASAGLAGDAQVMFAKLFGGTIKGCDSAAPSSARCLDAMGLVTGTDSVGSGAMSLFPIIAAVHGIEPGGTVIIEEPEAHLEPLSQQKMIADLVRAAGSRDVRLVLTTHSEYVVYSLLSMVSHGDLDRAELGVYYFRLGQTSHTRIEKIDVTKDGEVDTELFRDALDALGTRV